MRFLKIALPVLFCAIVAWSIIHTKPVPEKPLTPQIQDTTPDLHPTTETITPIPLTLKVNQQKADLGKRLFFDTRLSRTNTVSCASCHNLATGGTDGLRYSTGVNGKFTEVNTPTVFNSALHYRQFWDGRALTLEEQAKIMVTLPAEMGSDWPITISKLKTDAGYTRDFAKIYADGITQANVSNAIAEFERTLLTPNSRFDHFLRGDVNALTPQEKQGYETFKTYGCISCHQGMMVGGNMFERMGSVRDYFQDRGHVQTADLGLYNITHDEKHRYYFKVSSLRNIEKTAPYFHDGSASTLEEAVKVMAKYNLGLTMPESDVNDITAFLKTLTGEYQGKPL